MRRLALLVLLPATLALTLLLSSDAQASTPEWTFIFYLGVDDDEMTALVDPRLAAMLKGPLPEQVEVLVEQDVFKPDGIFRYIRRGQELTRETLPEHDSADPARFEDFLRWAKANSRGKRTCLVVNTHSWGWRGIIEDFTVPGRPKYDSLMPMDAFAAAFAKAKARFDVLWLDTCIMGNAEPIEECKNAASYLILSQREIADNGLPFEAIWEVMDKRPTLKQFLRAIPERYVQLYARNGEMVPEIKYYYVTSVVSVDTRKWDRFAGEFKTLVDLLRENNFLWTVKFRPDLLDAIVEGDDRNVDIVEFLSRVGEWTVDPRIGEKAKQILERIGYPKDVAALSSQSYLLEAAKIRSFELRIDADNYLTRPPDKLQSLFIGKWREANQDLRLPSGLSYELVSVPGSKRNERQFVIRGELKQDLRFRPWFAGTQYFILTVEDRQGRATRKTFARDKDYFVAERFPESSYLVAEAHTQGTPFLHGVGMMLYPWMSVYMPKSTNQITGLKGTPYYKATAWSRRTGWGEATLVNP